MEKKTARTQFLEQTVMPAEEEMKESLDEILQESQPIGGAEAMLKEPVAPAAAGMAPQAPIMHGRKKKRMSTAGRKNEYTPMNAYNTL